MGCFAFRSKENEMNWPLSHITLMVTQKCNLSCKGCYVNSSIGREWNIHEFKDKIVLPFVKLGGKSIGFSGGEPLLYNDIFEAIRIAKQHNLLVSLVTNGVLLNPDCAQILAKLRLDSLQISLDSSDTAYNEYMRGIGNKSSVITAIKNANEAGLPTNLVAVPNQSLLHNFDSYVKEAIHLKIRSIYVRRRIRKVPYGELEEEIAFNRDFLEKIKELRLKYPAISIISGDPLYNISEFDKTDNNLIPLFSGCSAGITSLAIWPDGKITPCTRLSIPVGNVFENGLNSTWLENDMLYNLRRRDLHNTCGICKFKYVCGGCRASAYIESDDVFATDPICFNY